MAFNNNNANSTSSSSSLLSIHNHVDANNTDDDNDNEELLNNFLLLTSPPRKKTKISNETTTTTTTTTTTNTRIPPSLSFETIISKTNINNELNLYLIKQIVKKKNDDDDDDDEMKIELKLVNLNFSTNEVACYLYDSWTSCLIKENYIVNVLCEPESDGSYRITDKNNAFIIVNPHIILSGTTILSSLSCVRKSALAWKFRDTSGSNSHMMLGNLLHMLFQDAVKSSKFSKADLNRILTELLKQKLFVNQIFESNINQEHLVSEAISYLDSIEKWLREHVKVKPTLFANKQNIAAKPAISNKNGAMNFQIIDVCDIEESIWSPKYGIKGKIDLTLQIEKQNEFSSKKLSPVQFDTIPVELKSGRSTFSVEHEGQVMLYALLNKEKRKNFDYGLLLYLKDAKMKFIKATQNNLKGLIQLRNDLVHYICANSLPELKNEERFCSKCSQLTVCSLFNDIKSSTIRYETSTDLYAKSVSHLKDSHKAFFFKWYKMLDLEFQDAKQFDAGEMIWSKSVKELETVGYTVGSLKLVANTAKIQTSANELEDEIKSFMPFEFRRDNNNNLTNCQLKENDMILLSIQSENQIGISQGFVKSITNQNCNYLLLIDKALDARQHKFSLFRIDKVNFRSAICANYTNLMKLMEPNERSERLRELIIDKRRPTFEKVLAKSDILQTKEFFKHLNQNQKLAIIKTLMSHEYLLIKGYPGTGKTSTIAALIAILVKLGKKVLFTSYTNSAVDNLLLKVAKEYTSVKFTRIGSFERIHADIRKFESSVLAAKIDNVNDLRKFYDNMPLIATTCSSMTNSVFNRIEFDYCIVDEASQVLQTICLGPLLVAKKFVLVGDAEQLPPIIKNKDARLEGMGVSLFEHLDLNENYIELVSQYRMNSEIMSIANEISYGGKLKCISDEVANKKIKFHSDKSSIISDKLFKEIQSKSVIFLDTVNLIASGGGGGGEVKMDENEKLNRSYNPTEAEIIAKLCHLFTKNSDCRNIENIGIIAPYNDQVKLLQKRLKDEYRDIEINTVDQFQGRDKRIIIVSFSNSIIKEEATKEFEILNDKRRLTVAITRAKEKLILVGCTKALSRYKPLEKLINVIKDKNSLYELNNVMNDTMQ